MMRPQLRQLARHAEVRGVFTPARQFSVSRVVLDEKKPSAPTPAPAASRSPKSTQPRKPQSQSRGPSGANSGSPLRRPAKAIDARSFAAPTSTTDQPKIIRSPRLRNVRPGSGAGGPGGARGRKPTKAASKNAKPKRERRPRDARAEFIDEGLEAAEEAAIAKVESDQLAKERPIPVRYEPKEIGFDKLKATWPHIPSDGQSGEAIVLSKLAGLSGRFANGYVPANELGRKIWKGESVLFESVKEQEEAMEEVKRLAQGKADKVSRRKGELVQPGEVKFKGVGIKSEEGKGLLEKFVQGKYPALQEQGKEKHVAIGDVTRNLRNNGTYETAGKRALFMDKVESLLAARVKRA